ncbi:hypothetical protein Efla_007607 [Eimeria flavescens]
MGFHSTYYGLDWLQKNNLRVDWDHGSLMLSDSNHCYKWQAVYSDAEFHYEPVAIRLCTARHHRPCPAANEPTSGEGPLREGLRWALARRARAAPVGVFVFAEDVELEQEADDMIRTSGLSQMYTALDMGPLCMEMITRNAAATAPQPRASPHCE